MDSERLKDLYVCAVESVLIDPIVDESDKERGIVFTLDRIGPIIKRCKYPTHLLGTMAIQHLDDDGGLSDIPIFPNDDTDHNSDALYNAHYLDHFGIIESPSGPVEFTVSRVPNQRLVVAAIEPGLLTPEQLEQSPTDFHYIKRKFTRPLKLE